MKETFVHPKYHGKPLTQNINLDLIDLERLDRALKNKEECDRKRVKEKASQESE